MDPDFAEPPMKALDTTGAELANAWRHVPTDTLTGEVAIGVDKLGWAFREGLGGGQVASDFGNGYIGKTTCSPVVPSRMTTTSTPQ